MTLPLLLLGLYLGLLAASIALSSWLEHSADASEDARRVVDASERAALSHLFGPAKLSALSLVVLATLSATTAAFMGKAVLWFLLVPFIVPGLGAGLLLYCARKLLRTSGDLVALTSKDTRISLMSKAGLASVLCAEAGLGLILLSLHTVASLELGSDQAQLLVVLAAASISVPVILFARASAAAILATTRNQSTGSDAPHPGTLAELVAGSFHAPFLKLLLLAALGALGHSALVFTMESSPNLWLYPHLLKLLGLCALLFSGLIVRVTEDEPPTSGWTRGALVYVILMIAGAWSLSTELPEAIARAVPSGLSFLFLLLAVMIWTAPRPSPSRHTLLVRIHRRFPSIATFFGLLTLLILASSLAPEEVRLNTTGLVRLLIAGTLALSPLAALWLIARDLSVGASHARELTHVGELAPALSKVEPTERFLGALPLLSLVVALGALGNAVSTSLSGTLLSVVVGCAALFGGLNLFSLLGLTDRASLKPGEKISQLVEKHHRADSTPDELNLQKVVDAAKTATTDSGALWLFVALLPLLIAIALQLLAPGEVTQTICLGMGLGLVISGAATNWALSPELDVSRRSLASLALTISLAQCIGLIAVCSMH